MKSFEFWYDSNQKHAIFNGLLKSSEQEIEEYFNNLTEVIKKKRKQIKKLKNTNIEVIKKDLEPKLYELLVNNRIKTMFDLASGIWVSPFRGVQSKIPNIAKVKGEKLVNAMYKNGFPDGRNLVYEQEKKDE